jgi:hypothetical protein
MSRKLTKVPAIYMVRHLVSQDTHARTLPLPAVLPRIEEDFKAYLMTNPEAFHEVVRFFLKDSLRRLRHDRTLWLPRLPGDGAASP